MLYIAALQPFIFRGAEEVLFEETQRPLLGILLLALFILEIPALIVKIRQVTNRTRKTLAHQNRVAVFWTLHLLSAVLVGFVAIEAISADFINSSLGAAIFIAIFVKEFVLLFLLVIPKVTSPKHVPLQKRELISSVILILFACVSYTAFWEVFISSFEKVSPLTIGGFLQMLIFTGFFLIIYLPARFGFSVERLLQPPESNHRLAQFATLMLAIFFGLLPLILF